MPEARVICTACLECSLEFLLSGGNLIQESLVPKTCVFLLFVLSFFLDFMRRKIVMFLGDRHMRNLKIFLLDWCLFFHRMMSVLMPKIWSRSRVCMLVLIWYYTLFGLYLNRDSLDLVL
jgi:hypothetical protein